MISMSLWLATHAFNGMRHTFYEDLAESLEDKASLAEEIDKHAGRAETDRDVVAPLFRLWSRRMDDRSFAQALEGTVPDSDVMVLSAAEEAGNLPGGLTFVAFIIGATKQMRGALYAAVSGFVFLSTFLIALLSLFSFYGISIIEEIVPPNAWPWIGQVLRDFAHFITGNGIWLLTGLITWICSYWWSLRNWYGPMRVYADRFIPFYTIYRDFQGAIFLVSLAGLMRSKVNLNEALEKLARQTSPWLRWHIQQIMLRLDYESDEPGKAFATGIFNRRLTWRIIDFGARSSFPVAIEKVGLRSIHKITEDVKKSASKINKALIVVMGFMIAFIVLGTLLTMFEAQNALQQQISTSAVPK